MGRGRDFPKPLETVYLKTGVSSEDLLWGWYEHQQMQSGQILGTFAIPSQQPLIALYIYIFIILRKNLYFYDLTDNSAL